MQCRLDLIIPHKGQSIIQLLCDRTFILHGVRLHETKAVVLFEVKLRILWWHSAWI